ncbi:MULTISPECIES: hypothetical protein [unclassified Aureispira]|uniref:hypothetical protein n=1 Tax=unclassified Aureispira TaxID=2649989 RepID=UPI0006991E56|nr:MULTISPECIES: hypothetical protein [unclassified Aureispira]WMX13431.1 hypothetical protein QP953_21525 [Aureispira sp. CCB-E]
MRRNVSHLFLVVVLLTLTNVLKAQCTEEAINMPTNWESNAGLEEPKTLVLETTGIKELKLLLYTRRGTKIFESSSSVLGASNETIKMLDTGWDGTKLGKTLRAGLYVYTIEAQCVDKSIIHKTGQIVLTVKS